MKKDAFLITEKRPIVEQDLHYIVNFILPITKHIPCKTIVNLLVYAILVSLLILPSFQP